MVYRRATIEDIPELVNLRMEFLLEENRTKFARENELRLNIHNYFLENIPSENFISWICLDQKQIIATSGITFYYLPPNYANVNGLIGYIANMYTKKEFRKQGIASKLFEKLIIEGRAKKASKLVLHTTEDGKRIYLKFGFIFSDNEMHLNL